MFTISLRSDCKAGTKAAGLTGNLDWFVKVIIPGLSRSAGDLCANGYGALAGRDLVRLLPGTDVPG